MALQFYKDQDGSMEVVFNTDDHYLHVWEPESNSEIDGWPVHIGEISVTEPIIKDLNNDLKLEVINTIITGDINIFNRDGSRYDNFPYISNDSTLFTPTVGDLDQDGDIEIKIVGLRHGEKLFEELMIGNSNKKTEHPKIIQINEKFEPLRKIIKAIAGFNEDNNTENILRTKNLLKRIVKDYNPEN